MSVKYSIDKVRRLIISVGEGVVWFDDIKEHQNRLQADPDFDPTFDQLIDTIRVTRIVLSPDEARTLASWPIVSRYSRRAFVVTQPHIFGLDRLMEVYHENLVQVHIFYSMEEALNWLERTVPVG